MLVSAWYLSKSARGQREKKSKEISSLSVENTVLFMHPFQEMTCRIYSLPPFNKTVISVYLAIPCLATDLQLSKSTQPNRASEEPNVKSEL